MRAILACLLVLIGVAPASATMATLTEMPERGSAEACRAWAERQDDDARFMWGMLNAGGSSPEIGIMRLTLRCLGDPKPEIVGFGSSAGFDEAYCRRHKSAGICKR